MVEGPLLLVIFMLAIAFIILMTAKVKMNAFLVLLLTAFGVGLAVGMDPLTVIKTVTGGFGSILSYIGIVIICGTIIGTILEKSQATLTMAETVLGLVGRARSALAMSITGAVVSISVFCDSGYVILSSLNNSLARKAGLSMTTMAVALSTGLYATHTFVPPTPGPIAAAGNLGADIGLVIMLGLTVSVPAIIAAYIWAVWIGRRIFVAPEPMVADIEDAKTTLPGRFVSFSPILVPILLISLKSIGDLPGQPFGDSGLKKTFDFIGDPSVALILGVFLAFRLLPKWDEHHLNGWVSDGLRSAASIIMITGAGGAFGSVLKATPIGDYLSVSLSQYQLGIFLPVIIASALKTAQGSSTVAIITTSALISPMLPQLGLDSAGGRALAVIATGAGAMIVSHANDSYFWVVTQFSKIDTATAYKTYTAATLIQGIVSIAAVYVLSLFIV